MSELITENLKAKWKPIIESTDGVAPISNNHQKAVMAQVLENTVKEGVVDASILDEASGTGNTGINTTDKAFVDPVLISMVRRTQPLLIANEVVGVQPMKGPTGLIFAFEATNADGTSLLHNNADNTRKIVDTTLAGKASTVDGSTADNIATAEAEALGQSAVAGGTGAAGDPVVYSDDWTNLSFKITKTGVTAHTKALKAHYTHELAQDLKAVHGLDAESELANILSTEVVSEINRELITKLGSIAVVNPVALDFTTGATAFDFRWEGDKFAYLAFAIAKEASKIALGTGRGRGNFIITSADVVSALNFAGKISGAVNGSLSEYTGSVSYAGMMNGMKVYIDDFNTDDSVLVGYKGSNQYDAGLFYTPYVPLQMFKGQGEEDFQPRIGFKSRYGVVEHPQYTTTGSKNLYYRKLNITSL